MLKKKKLVLLPKIAGLLIILIALMVGVMIKYYEEDSQIALYQKTASILNTLEIFDLNALPLDRIKALDTLDLRSLEAGKSEMIKHKLVIVGIARDNIDDILVMIRNISYIGSQFQDYRVIIFENDSQDGTKIALNIWQQKDPKVKILSQDFGNRKRPSHLFMAEVRNQYLSALEDKSYNEFDLVMMIDMDMSHGVDIRSIEDSFSKINRWDGVCSNGIANVKGQMYDMFAFRSDEFPFSPNKWQEICSQDSASDKWTAQCKKGEDYSKGWLYNLLAFRVGWHKINRLYWLKIAPQGQKVYPVSADLIPVNSCFGGLAFYKREFIKGCRYDSIDNDCEHVAFHQCLKSKHHGKMMMNPAQLIRYSQY